MARQVECELISPGGDSSVHITAVTKLKHADLWAAAKKMGSQSKLARHLEVGEGELGQWINLSRVPPREPIPGNKKWTEERMAMLEGRLIVLTGKSWEELFPDALRRNKSFLDCAKTIERTEEVQEIAIAEYASSKAERLRRTRDDEIAGLAVIDNISTAMSVLNFREQEIVKLRFGLENGERYTLEEVGHIFKISRDRVSQIEHKALRKLSQRPELAEYRMDCLSTE